MRIRITRTARIQAPKKGMTFKGYGISGRAGYYECQIEKVNKRFITLETGQKMKMMDYILFEFARSDAKPKIEVLK